MEIRPASVDDRPAINALLRRALNVGDDPRYDRFLEWKHRANPFGSSYEWVATIDDVVVGYRSFLRWELIVDGAVRSAVRAVDTATDPEHHGKGVFRALTEQGVEHLAADGVAWVFNTPNDASRPGYLKMGWSVVGRLPVAVMARSPLTLRHVRRARQPAARWSEPCAAFEPAVEAIERIVGDGDCAVTAPADRWATNRTPAFLRWRYGLDDLHYRGFCPDDTSVVVFRVRRRGPLREALIADVIGRCATRAAGFGRAEDPAVDWRRRRGHLRASSSAHRGTGRRATAHVATGLRSTDTDHRGALVLRRRHGAVLMARRPTLIHLTTTDISLALLLQPQLKAFADAGYDVIGMSAPGPYVDDLDAGRHSPRTRQALHAPHGTAARRARAGRAATRVPAPAARHRAHAQPEARRARTAGGAISARVPPW